MRCTCPVADIGSVSVLQGLQPDYKDVYPSYLNLDEECDDTDCVERLQYVPSNDDVLDIPGREVTSMNRLVGDIQVRRWTQFLPVTSSPGPRKTHNKATQAVCSVPDFSAAYRIWLMMCQSPQMSLLKKINLRIFEVSPLKMIVNHLQYSV